jgi:ectoine hydroxylase-related dioxygenase (phytanoyl-CoA dioxygenase family)
MRASLLTEEQHESWDANGYFLVKDFAAASVREGMIDRIVELARAIDDGEERPDLLVSPENTLSDAPTAEGRLSKIFRVMRSEDVFREFATDDRLLAILSEVMGRDIDCFLSQFIFKQPGAMGQPWHQDEWYFRMDPPKQVGVWLACTDATPENGPLWVVPGSHRELVHEDVVEDPRPGANMGYVEIQGADTSNEQQILMTAGDLLVFDCHLRHRSTNNVSDGMRAAMVYHYSPAGTEVTHEFTFNQDWVPVLRDGRPALVDATPVPIDWGTPG